MKIQLRHVGRAFWLLILIVGMVDVNHAYGSAHNVNQAVVKPFPNIGPINRGFEKHIIDGGEHSDIDQPIERNSWHFSEDAENDGNNEKKGNSLPHSKGGPVSSLPLNKEQSKVKIITTDEDAEYRFPDDDNNSDDDTVLVASSSSSIKTTLSESNNDKKKEEPEHIVKKEEKSEEDDKHEVSSEEKNDKHAVIDEESVQDNGSIGGNQATFSLHLMGQGKYKSASRFPCISEPGEVFGIARLMNTDQNLDKIRLFDMPQDDRCVGRIQFDDLMPDTNYDVWMGYVKGDKDNFSGGLKPADFNWEQAHEFNIKTPPEKPGDVSSFVYGSCARISSFGPIDFKKGAANQILQTMHEDIVERETEENALRTDAILTLGDFPYMDFWGPVFPANDFNGFCERNELLYGLTGCRRLMDGCIPVHQVRDDHEFENDSSAEIPNGKQRMYDDAQESYDLFQRPQGRDTPHPWQEITAGNLEAFMLDIRSERLPSQNPPQMISQAQMDALKAWLLDKSRTNRIKPIMISNPFLCLQTEDTFSGFPEQQTGILKFIKDNKIPYVAFFAGDIHFGKTGLWKFDEEGMPFIFEDVSSSLRNIAGRKLNMMQKELDLTEAAGGLRLSTVGELSPSITQDLYTRVVLNHPKHTIRIIKKNRTNELLSDVEYDLKNGTYKDVEDKDVEGSAVARFSHSYTSQSVDNDMHEVNL